MPGIDYQRVREAISMEDVLGLLCYEPTLRRGDQWYGSCPFHESPASQRTVFAIHVVRNCYYCHKCHRKGNQLTLWASISKTPLHGATIELCERLGKEIPWMHRW